MYRQAYKPGQDAGGVTSGYWALDEKAGTTGQVRIKKMNASEPSKKWRDLHPRQNYRNVGVGG